MSLFGVPVGPSRQELRRRRVAAAQRAAWDSELRRRRVVADRQAARQAATDAWLSNRKRRKAEAEPVAVEDLVVMTTVPADRREPARAVAGWRFGAVIDGAVASPWVPGLTWPTEGQAAACVLQRDRAAPGSREITSPRVLRAHGRDHVPVPLCCCGLYLERNLEDLLRPMPPGSAREVMANLMGVSALAVSMIDAKRGYWGMRVPPDAVFQAQGWGRHALGDDPPTCDRFQYMRLRPGGRLHLRRTRAEHAQALADRYGVDVIVGTASGWKWLEEIRNHERTTR